MVSLAHPHHSGKPDHQSSQSIIVHSHINYLGKTKASIFNFIKPETWFLESTLSAITSTVLSVK